MKRLFLAASAAGMLMAAPALAQMAPPPPPGGPMGGPMMGGPMMGGNAGKSCVMNGAFVPCPPAGGMQPAMMDDRGMGMREPGMERRMSARERREMRRMERMERMQQRGM